MFQCIYQYQVNESDPYAGVTHYNHAEFGEGTGEIHIGYLSCSESKYRVKNCYYSTDTEYDYHYQDWSVYCGRG